MLDYIIGGTAVGISFLYILNNYYINIMATTNIGSCKNRCGWMLLKTYAVGKRKCLGFTSRFTCKLRKRKLFDNILFIKDGNRLENIRTKENTNLIKQIINKKDYDLVLFRTPSKHGSVDYDIIRLDDAHIDNILKLPDDDEYTCEYKESKCTIISPVLQIEHNPITHKSIELKMIDDKAYADTDAEVDADETKENDKSDLESKREVYELLIEEDNYFIVGNKIFDEPFVRWLLREQHNKILKPSEEYNIYYFDGNINQFKIDNNEFITVHSDLIENGVVENVSDITETQSEGARSDDENHKREAEKANSWSYFSW